MTNSERLRQMREANAPRERITAKVLLRHAYRSGKPKADKKFVAWMHTQPCLVARFGGCGGAMTFHHLRRFGGKRDDLAGLPLCQQHHLHGAGPDAIHRLGKAAFQARFGVDLEQEARKYREMWEALR